MLPASMWWGFHSGGVHIRAADDEEVSFIGYMTRFFHFIVGFPKLYYICMYNFYPITPVLRGCWCTVC